MPRAAPVIRTVLFADLDRMLGLNLIWDILILGSQRALSFACVRLALWISKWEVSYTLVETSENAEKKVGG